MTLSLTGCVAHSWKATPKDVPSFRRCDPIKKFPQMIEIPGFDSTWQIVSDCELYPGEQVAVALSIFYLEWMERFGSSSSVRENMHSLFIEFSSAPRTGSAYSIDGQYINNATFSGLTLTQSNLWVLVENPNERICETSLVHELVHSSIWAIKDTDGDPDHMGSKYRGWSVRHSLMVQEVNELLCRLGI